MTTQSSSGTDGEDVAWADGTQAADQDHTPRPAGRLTDRTIDTVFRGLIASGVVFRVGEERLARHFCTPFYGGNALRASLEELRHAIGALEGCGEIPTAIEDFARWIREDVLDLKKLPRDALASLYEHASEDLAAIERTVNECEAELEALNDAAEKSEGDESRVRFLRYYLKRNVDARQEILDVLTHQIRHEALRASVRPVIQFMDFHVPWSYRWRPERFSPGDHSTIRHAFVDLSVLCRRKVQELFGREDKTEFDTFLSAYLGEKRPVDAVRAALKEHHLLAARAAVLVPALNAYERGELALFASAAAIQVEGLFEDACALSGVSPDALRLGSITTKVELLDRKHPGEIDFVYYAFEFPVLRNRVAHGRMLSGDLRRTADLLVLDLRDVCQVVSGHPAPANALVKFLRRVDPATATVADAVEFAVLLVETQGNPPDGFYNLAAAHDAMRLTVERGSVWSVLTSLEGKRDTEVDAGLRFLAQGLKALRPAIAGDCNKLLKCLDARGMSFDRSAFLASVRAHAAAGMVLGASD